MNNPAKTAPAQLWLIQVKLGSLIFLFEHFRSDAFGDDDQPLSGVAQILRDVQSDLNWIRESVEKVGL